ncbi:hypothetical protein AY601_0447 [Pedobacter cryoconitis]|uniref:Uncharacterized protein n=1 Tax=Pedobacter cryoconitis TaxID=188932 RepID=A0A127V7W7_9SPHI|nr:hypothetical protein [Pedobacter cryoconitis]AMP97403.1 hypothetical protein AY601_0447 [Pedobacter cryoconitis]
MKISFKTYLNDRLKQVDFHGQLTYPLYVQVTYERKPIYFKSYYFELFSKPRYLLTVPGVGSKAPTIDEIIERENEVISFIIEKYKDNFSLELFKTAYTYYSKDLCDIMEKGFIDYLHTFFWDEGNPAFGDVLLQGCKNVIAFDVVRDFKRIFNKSLYEKLVTNSLYYAPPYLPLYGFMTKTKRWPMLILTVMEFNHPDTRNRFYEYASKYYSDRPADELLERALKWIHRI